MAIEPGQKLLHYELVEQIGEGGMGVVWKAVDSALDREVAVKVLPEAFDSQPERAARFEREAKLLASLNHANIASVYGLHREGETSFIAMEFVPGEDLSTHIERGALTVDAALTIAVQVAEALEAAHEQGVIHRDLKPANIRVMPDGKVKVLDFGLAKAMSTETSDSTANPALSPTLTSTGTLAGTILGTAAYMSPEQASGLPVDRRADVWAFGVVLLEMLSGKTVFGGDTVSHVLASILKDETDLSRLPAATPGAVRRLIRACLQKKPRRRLQAIGDARVVVEDVLEGREADEPSAPTALPRRNRLLALPWVAAVVLALVAGIASWKLKTTPVRQAVRFPVTVSGGFASTFFPDNVSVSPDGRTLIYAGQDQLYRRDIGALEAQPISGTEGALSPAFSPDGAWISFQRPEIDQLWKIPASGGRPVRVCDRGCAAVGVSWGTDDTIVFGRYSDSLWRVPANGGDPVQISTLGEGELGHTYPEILPGGDAVLFTIWRGDVSKSEVGLLSLETGEHRALTDGIHPRYATTGHVVFVRDGSLWARPFNPDSLEFVGDASRILGNVSVDGFMGAAQFAIAKEGGTLAYLSGDTLQETSLVWLDRNGTSLKTVGDPGLYGQLGLSPDEQHVAVEVLDPDTQSYDIWVLELTTGIMSRVTFDSANDRDPVWSPDSQSLVFTSTRNSGGDIFHKTLGQPGSPVLFHALKERIVPEHWSSDALIYIADKGPQEFHALSLKDKTIKPILQTRFYKDEPHLSPNGNWLAYESAEAADTPQIYIASFPDMNQRQVSRAGGVQPRWRGDGDELYFLSLDGDMMAVRPSESRPPEVLFATGIDVQLAIDQYSVSSDGERFLFALPTDRAASQDREIKVVVNWFEELDQSVLSKN